MPALARALPLIALALPCAAAQSFNVDVGSAGGTPSASYAAGAAQAGHWNHMPDGSGTALALLDGSPSGATAMAFGFLWSFAFDNPGTTGDDELLLDDACSFARSYSFTGLLDGDYEVWTYAWAPDDPTYRTKVEVFNSPDPAQFVGGAWTGSHQLGVTYAKHRVTTSMGELGVLINNSVGPATVNGFQLVYLGAGCPQPATYCTAKTSSSGCVPAIGASGTPSPGGGFAATCANVEASQLGVLIHATSGAAAAPFQGGFLCVQPPVQRLPAQGSGGSGACTGSYTQPLDGVIQGLPAGTQVWAQFWFRDPGAMSGSGLSNGLTFTTCT